MTHDVICNYCSKYLSNIKHFPKNIHLNSSSDFSNLLQVVLAKHVIGNYQMDRSAIPNSNWDFFFFIKGLTRMTSVANVFTKQNYTNPALRGAVHIVGGEKGKHEDGQ